MIEFFIGASIGFVCGIVFSLVVFCLAVLAMQLIPYKKKVDKK